MKRDVLMFVPWLVWKLVYWTAMTIYGFGVWCMITKSVEGAVFAVIPATIIPIFTTWIDAQITSLPALFWRHRKNFTMRVVDVTDEGRRAIQIKLFGLWWYVELDPNYRTPPEIKLFNVHGISVEYDFEKRMDQREAERAADRIVNNHIRPPRSDLNVSEDLQYSNYNRIDRSKR